jgi:hypothetical protein
MAAKMLKARIVLSMSANPLDVLSAHPGLRGPAAVERGFRPERRKRARTHLHWPLLLFRGQNANAIESLTVNLSSNGFYCMSPTPFMPGESLVCALKVPAYDPTGEEKTLALECKVQVVRAEPAGEAGFFGIACRIEDYHLLIAGARQGISV